MAIVYVNPVADIGLAAAATTCVLRRHDIPWPRAIYCTTNDHGAKEGVERGGVGRENERTREATRAFEGTGH